MINAIHFKNFRILKDARLPLGPFTVIVGANSSGKSTALLGLAALANPQNYQRQSLTTIGDAGDPEILLDAELSHEAAPTGLCWTSGGLRAVQGGEVVPFNLDPRNPPFGIIQVFQFQAAAVSTPQSMQSLIRVSDDGAGLASTLDRLRDVSPERFDDMSRELHAWFPEFDRLLFDVNGQTKHLRLRRTGTEQAVPAEQLSDGTRLALALLTLAFLPDPPAVIAIEEPERGIHPRLLTEVHQALYRLAFPDAFGDDRAPVQVIVTTHSPYFLDLFKDHPEEVVIADRKGPWATFRSLTADPRMKDDILAGAPLGDVWYTGILGGVPEAP